MTNNKLHKSFTYGDWERLRKIATMDIYTCKTCPDWDNIICVPLELITKLENKSPKYISMELVGELLLKGWSTVKEKSFENALRDLINLGMNNGYLCIMKCPDCGDYNYSKTNNSYLAKFESNKRQIKCPDCGTHLTSEGKFIRRADIMPDMNVEAPKYRTIEHFP